jgi:hypothetical protein
MAEENKFCADNSLGYFTTKLISAATEISYT